MADELNITVIIQCRDLPGAHWDGREGVRLGIQKGDTVIEDVLANAEEVSFTVPLRVGRNAKTGRPNFLGPFAQGPADGRFIYLCWGERDDGRWEGFRRAKILLDPLDWGIVGRAANSDTPIEALVSATDASGGPISATLRDSNVRWEL
jgi:hypothetical protein